MAAPTIHLYSFGYSYSGPPADDGGHGGGFVFDCRSLPNPFWDEKLRPFKGNEAPIIAFMEARPEVRDFHGHAAALVLSAARAFAADGRERLMVSFGCTGGRHRSVYQAERLAAALREAGFVVELRHLDIDRAPEDAAPSRETTP